ncbi:MAG: divergent polysaccharide deacetylase family protein [Rhodobacteraceae bacterium]|nr:divergent polysaccharide deacetylase family protein [Paracoccaceae bacterium]
MANRRKQGGGFLRGVLYGLVLSGITFVALSVTFPLTEKAPLATIGDPIQIAPQAFDVGPGETENAGVNLGNTNDSPVSITVSTALDTNVAENAAPAEQPTVETESTGIPDIGIGNDQSVAVTPVVVTTPEAIAPPEEITPTVDVSTAVIPVETVAPPALEVATSDNGFEVFAIPFERNTDLSMLSIVFIDTDEASLQPLYDTGVPLNFAILANDSSAQASKSFRNRGYEVLAMLPQNVPVDAGLKETLINHINSVQGAIGLIDSNIGGLMRDTPSIQTMLEAAVDRGVGTVAFAGVGDGNASYISSIFNIPYGTITRIIDEDPDKSTILQALDQAALNASINGSAIVFARTRATTIEALAEWLSTPVAEAVQIVPISVVMRP